MKTLSNYQQAKVYLKRSANNIRQDFKDDLPAQRMYINNEVDCICKDWAFGLSEYQQNLLHNYACTLHPKN